MRRTRLAAAGVAAVVGLSSAIAAADTTGEQTVTITVEALARTVTTGGDATLTIAAGAAGSTAEVSGSPTIAYTNGADGAAKITAALTEIAGGGNNLEDNWVGLFGTLELGISLEAAAGAGNETAASGTSIGSAAASSFGAVGNLLNGIPTNVDRSATAVAYTLGGTAPNTARLTALTITFTIADADVDADADVGSI